MRPLLTSLLLVTAIGTGVVLCAQAAGDIPKTISFQGRLADEAGRPVPDGFYGIRFRIYDVETGGSPLWEKIEGVYVTGGMFDAVLGDETPIDLPFDRTYWIGIKVATDEDEVVPRVRLTASPYSINADRVDGLDAATTPTAGALLALDADRKLPTDITGDAATVGGFAASQTPSANTILPLDDAAKFPSEVIPQMGDADTVDGFDASDVATPNTLLALDQNAKLPASITGDANTLDGFHASASPAANNLLPLDASSKFPNSVLYTGHNGGLDADMLDTKHAADFVGKTGTQTITGATTGYDGVLTVTNTSTGVAVKGLGNTGGIGIRGEGTQFGVYGYSDEGYGGRFQGKSDGSGLGLYVKGSSYFTGYATFNGGKTGYVVDICACADPGGLSSGDVVVIAGASEPVVGDIPTMNVRKADSKDAAGVVGVVDKLFDGISFCDAPIGEGDLLSVVTLGAYRWVNAEATAEPIRPGDLLTSSGLAGYARRAANPEPGSIVGKALDSLESGKAKIRVFVSAR